jgi:ATP-dependent Clp protease ATP-binding subunit ClpA
MFERFTDKARRVLVLAQTEASNLSHNFIGTEHVLLALLDEGEGVAAKALIELGVDPAAIRDTVKKTVGPSPEGVGGPAPFTPRTKKVLELSLREALGLGHNYIGTEHLLLGLVHEGEGVGAQVLIVQGLTLELVREKVLSLLGGVAPRTGQLLGTTTAGSRLPVAARMAAKGAPVGSQHYLLALLADKRALAHGVLTSLGVTPEAVRKRIEELGPAGTDDVVQPAFTATAEGGEVHIRILDPRMAERVRAGELVVTFTSPEAEPEPETPEPPEPETPGPDAPTGT